MSKSEFQRLAEVTKPNFWQPETNPQIERLKKLGEKSKLLQMGWTDNKKDDVKKLVEKYPFGISAVLDTSKDIREKIKSPTSPKETPHHNYQYEIPLSITSSPVQERKIFRNPPTLNFYAADWKGEMFHPCTNGREWL